MCVTPLSFYHVKATYPSTTERRVRLRELCLPKSRIREREPSTLAPLPDMPASRQRSGQECTKTWPMCECRSLAPGLPVLVDPFQACSTIPLARGQDLSKGLIARARVAPLTGLPAGRDPPGITLQCPSA
jgi:hypothetical protein